MSGMEPKKLALLRILQILHQDSDEAHPMTQKQIGDRLERDYGIALERKAIGRNLALLKEAGIDMDDEHLDDVYMTVDCNRMTITVSPVGWYANGHAEITF